MMLKKIVKGVIIFVLPFLFGVLCTMLWFRYDEWSQWGELNTSNFLSIVSIMVNIILATIVVFVLQKIQDIKRAEKNILIEKIQSEIGDIKNFIEDCCNEEKCDFYSIARFFKTSRSRLNKIMETHNKCQKQAKKLFREISNLNEILTDTPHEAEESKIKKGQIYLDSKQIQDTKIKMADIENSALDLIIYINRHAAKDL